MSKNKVISIAVSEELHETAKKMCYELLGKKNMSAYVSYLIKKAIDESKTAKP